MGLYSCLLLAMVMGHSLGLQTGKKKTRQVLDDNNRDGKPWVRSKQWMRRSRTQSTKASQRWKERKKKIPSHISKHNKSNSAEQLVEFFNARYFTLSSAPIDIFKRSCVQCPCIRFRSLVNIFINTRKKVEHLIILLFPPNNRAAHLSVC